MRLAFIQSSVDRPLWGPALSRDPLSEGTHPLKGPTSQRNRPLKGPAQIRNHRSSNAEPIPSQSFEPIP
eukprot:4483514-Heterocapsa_arctica.AAC.1